MNHVNFNDGISVADFVHFDGKNVVQQIPESVLQSPIFLWDDPEGDKLLSLPNSDDVFQLIADNPNAVPFRSMRLYIRANSTDRLSCKGFKVWMHHDGKSLHTRTMRVGEPGDENLVLGIRAGKDTVRGGNNGKEVEVSIRTGKTFLTQLEIANNPIRTQYLQAVWTSICWFIREVSSLSNFIASVIPDKKSKSVEWVKARTHYVLLHKAHPANSKQVAAGATVSRNAESIKRQAHTRRAHARVLRSPRFRNKLGLTIYVKATWVGPSEWKENGSIYRMAPRNQSFH